MTSNKQRVLVDSDAIYARIITSDANHSKATTISRKKFSQVTFYLTDFAAGEIATLLARRFSKEIANEFLSGLSSREFNLLYSTEEHFKIACWYFFKQSTKETSFVDCLNMAVCEKLKLDAIFSFDHVYEQNGFKLLK